VREDGEEEVRPGQGEEEGVGVGVAHPIPDLEAARDPSRSGPFTAPLASSLRCGRQLDKSGMWLRVRSDGGHAILPVGVGSFELNLPQGKYSALAANGNLCQQHLHMPTAFVGQNGVTFNQDTHIEVQGCPPAIYVVSHKVKGRTATIQGQADVHPEEGR